MTQTEDLAQFDPASFEHIPVLLNECLDGLNIDPAGTYLDGTAGGAGHSGRSPSGWTAQKAGSSSPSTRTPTRCRPLGRGWPGFRPRWCR